ncbi:uncharacterized protein LOC134527930 [Bacillus rossius redtenbacheri]|uniref:uncharacterized protein LOC134527930 n=1 Tax=Bacillus rossius redtenbacheri TaxID=93214 RepID=UPI002FDCEF5B
MAVNGERREQDDIRSLVSNYYRSFRSPSFQTVCRYYIPTSGVVSYLALSVNVMNPNWISSAAYKRSTTDFLLFGAIVGSGTYLYNRRVLTQAPTLNRVLYSGVGSVLFSFGSVLAWAIMRTYVSRSNALCTAVGLVLGSFFLGTCGHFLAFVDARTACDNTEDHAE